MNPYCTETLGSKLKTAREAKGLSLNIIYQETKIAARYLEALEQEDFNAFPGESYILGFLKNYGEYLDLDVNELLSLYRVIKIQEQPVPLERLFKLPSQAWVVIIAIIAAAAALGLFGAVVWFILPNLKK